MTKSESEYGGPVVTRIVALAQPILDDLGLTLYDCEHAGGTLVITLDKRRGDEPRATSPVLLDELSLFTRLLSRELDHDDPVPGRYTLEVSSPGLERRLRRPDHYAGAIGETVAIRLTHEIDGTRRLDGTLVASSDDGFTIRLDDATGTERRLRYVDVERAKTVFIWGPAPKPGKGPSKRGRSATAPAGQAEAEEASTTHSQEAAAS
ncbi:MAG: ribosome maturation factor RimP [Acidimicrobiia bacterium]